MDEKRICYNCFCERAETVGSCSNCGYDPEWDKDKYPLALPHGYVLSDKYMLGRVLGQGVYGITYLAMDKWLGTKVVVKEFFPEFNASRNLDTYYVTADTNFDAYFDLNAAKEDFQKRKESFQQEARVLAAFAGNPNVVRVHDSFEENGTAYFAMDYIQGISFKKHIENQGGKIPWKDAYEKLLPIIKTLEEVHKKGILHRNICPDNIYITSDGTTKLLDFASARNLLFCTNTGALECVVRNYGPIEQWSRKGKEGPFTDVYAICACFYMSVSSVLPPDAQERLIEDKLESFSNIGCDVPTPVETVIFKGLEKNPKDRYQNITELREALVQAVESADSSTVAPTEEEQGYPLALPHGHVLCDKYVLDCVLGQGGYGITYLATDKWLGTKVAIKEYFPEISVTRTTSTCHVTATSVQKKENFEKGKADFLQEARVLAAFANNPNIVRIHDYFEENGTAYFAMDYIDGISFQKYIGNQGGKIHWKDAYEKLMPIIKALEEVHKKDMIHRDISPDNIYITSDGTIKLLDFGAAREQSLKQSHSLDVILKHGYAPIEQYSRRGKQGPFTDVYAVCACFYAAVTGYLPPDATERVIEDTLSTFESLGFTIPQALSAVIYKGLAVNIENRYQNMTELREALVQAISGGAVTGATNNTAANGKPTGFDEGTTHSETTGYSGDTSNNKTSVSEIQRFSKMKEKWDSINGIKKFCIIAVFFVIMLFGITGCYQLVHDHSYGEWEIVEKPTCTKSGVQKRKCSCGVVEEEILPPKHVLFSDIEIPATCTASGWTEGRSCINCGYIEVEQQEIPPLGHTPVTDAAVEPSCGKVGKTEGSHCSVCGEIIVAQTTISAYEHSFSENACVCCGAAQWQAKVTTEKTTYSKSEYTVFQVTVYTNEKGASSIITYKLYRNGSLIEDTKLSDKKMKNGDMISLGWGDGAGIAGTFEIYVYNEAGYCIGYHSFNIVD